MYLKVTQVNKEPKDQKESRVFRAIKENLESKVIEELMALLVEKKIHTHVMLNVTRIFCFTGCI